MSRPEYNMVEIARRVLRENGFEPDMPQGIERSIPANDVPPSRPHGSDGSCCD